MQQRMYTVSVPGTLKFAIVWTRGTAFARAWAADKWDIDPVLIGVWPTTREDQTTQLARDEKDYYA